MTAIGTVIDDKYEILKEIGRGGMSIVYLAMDKRLNKQWAVKEIRKKGSGKNDEIIVNSLLAEANLMKRLDHPALPRIVDIIDNGVTIYIVMDYIEGESLDKILNEYGAQPEDKVIEWAKQLCDVLGYLHSQKPPIIYRDMKPANVMLKPEGNIKIIDFGIAREYKEQNLADTTVLGTKGYAPPEQYSGQTDPRSDIYALGMTMHHLLTGVDPRSGEAYASVRQWNPEISEGLEVIIDKCVEPAAENRYQSTSDLLYDLEHPDLITKGYKKKQKRKLYSFIAFLAFSICALIVGGTTNVSAQVINNNDYNHNLESANVEDYYTAIDIYPEKIEAYNKVIDYYKNSSAEATEENIKRIGNKILNGNLDRSSADVALLYYNMGKLSFSEYPGDFKTRAVYAETYFAQAVETETVYDKKTIASCYYSICRFMTNQSKTSEHSREDFEALIEEMEIAIEEVSKADDQEANFDKISLYYVTFLFLNDQSRYLAAVGYDLEVVTTLFNRVYNLAQGLTSSLVEVQRLQTEMQTDYESFSINIENAYAEAQKWQYMNESTRKEGEYNG